MCLVSICRENIPLSLHNCLDYVFPKESSKNNFSNLKSGLGQRICRPSDLNTNYMEIEDIYYINMKKYHELFHWLIPGKNIRF